MSKRFASIGLLLFGLGVGLALVEVVPRVIPHLMPKGFRGLERVYTGREKWEKMMVGDPYLGYRPKPQLDILYPSEGRNISVRTTSYGLGDIGFRDIGAHPPFDAITLGDSFTFCDDVPVASCWVRQLADVTGLAIGTLGVSGYSTLAEARMLERYGRQLKPRLVLLGLFANDFNDNLDFDEWVHSGTDNFWDWRQGKQGRGHVGHWLAEQSMIYRLVDGALRAHKQTSYTYKQGNLDLVFRTDRWWLPASDAKRVREREHGWELMQQALLDMHANAAAVGADLAVVLIPAKEEVYWDIVHPSTAAAETTAVDHPLAVVRDFCTAKGIHYCDLTAAMQAAARRGRQLYLRVSGHWNDDGNALAATTIARCLKDRGLLNGMAHAGRGPADPADGGAEAERPPVPQQ